MAGATAVSTLAFFPLAMEALRGWGLSRREWDGAKEHDVGTRAQSWAWTAS